MPILCSWLFLPLASLPLLFVCVCSGCVSPCKTHSSPCSSVEYGWLELCFFKRLSLKSQAFFSCLICTTVVSLFLRTLLLCSSIASDTECLWLRHPEEHTCKRRDKDSFEWCYFLLIKEDIRKICAYPCGQRDDASCKGRSSAGIPEPGMFKQKWFTFFHYISFCV